MVKEHRATTVARVRTAVVASLEEKPNSRRRRGTERATHPRAPTSIGFTPTVQPACSIASASSLYLEALNTDAISMFSSAGQVNSIRKTLRVLVDHKTTSGRCVVGTISGGNTIRE